MKLIIDISEDVYTRLFDNGIQDNEIAVDDICEMARALRQGTPLSEENNTQKLSGKENLCESCTNMSCEFQSGIKRSSCAFYMPPRLESDNCGNYIYQIKENKQ